MCAHSQFRSVASVEAKDGRDKVIIWLCRFGFFVCLLICSFVVGRPFLHIPSFFLYFTFTFCLVLFPSARHGRRFSDHAVHALLLYTQSQFTCCFLMYNWHFPVLCSATLFCFVSFDGAQVFRTLPHLNKVKYAETWRPTKLNSRAATNM